MAVTDDRDTPFWRTIGDLPDERFPLISVPGHMIDRPHRSSQLRVLCTPCARIAWFAGREICRHPDWLAAPVTEWAKALRCAGCGSRRLVVHEYHDPEGSEFMQTAHDSLGAAWERLKTWLAEEGLDVERWRDVVKDAPPRDTDARGQRPDPDGAYRSAHHSRSG